MANYKKVNSIYSASRIMKSFTHGQPAKRVTDIAQELNLPKSTVSRLMKQIINFMDALDLEKVNLVGNSFGGSLAMSVALEQPERVNKLILMGSVGVEAELPEALDKVWGYQPSFDNMAELVRLFTYDTDFADDDLIESRYQASLETGFQEAFETMFPAPRQNGLDDLSFPDDVIRTIKHPTLIVHGREDKIIPPAYSYRLIELIENAAQYFLL